MGRPSNQNVILLHHLPPLNFTDDCSVARFHVFVQHPLELAQLVPTQPFDEGVSDTFKCRARWNVQRLLRRLEFSLEIFNASEEHMVIVTVTAVGVVVLLRLITVFLNDVLVTFLFLHDVLVTFLFLHDVLVTFLFLHDVLVTVDAGSSGDDSDTCTFFFLKLRVTRLVKPVGSDRALSKRVDKFRCGYADSIT